MEVTKCYLYNNRSMGKDKKSCTPVGIVIHSTGANNKYVKRYIQPSKDDINYDQLIEKIGKNKFNNSWNRSTVNKSIHYMIGLFADNTVQAVQAMPTDLCCWACGSGKNGSYNYPPTAHIQIECCEDNLKDSDYFYNVYSKLVSVVVKLCIEYNFTTDKIVSHKEAHKLGYASNHKDIDHWFSKFGKTMDIFRTDVGIAMNLIKNSLNNCPSNNFNFILKTKDGVYDVTGVWKRIR